MQGKVKPSKHILLPVAVKTLTGNAELVRILNRYGHGISYTQMEGMETKLAIRKLETRRGEGAVPQEIHLHVMTTLA